MKRTYRWTSLILLFSVFLASAHAADRKKDKGLNAMGSTLAAAEPDALPFRSPKDRHTAAPRLIAFTSKARINTKYKEGIDVSHYQGTIDWDKVAGAEKISYVYLKATEGASLVDETYERNLSEARRVGLSVGSYHFYRPNVDWRTQLKNLTSVVKREDQDLVPIIDIEHRGAVSEEKFISDLASFIKEVTTYYGKKPLLYTYHNFYNKHLCGRFKDYHWMIARYRSDSPTLNDGKDYIMWQYTSTGSIPGVRGNVDRSKIMSGFNLNQVQM